MIVDTNVLLYAADAASPFHASAADWLTKALNGPTRIGLPWPVLTGFQRIATNARASMHPLAPRVAWSQVSAWLATPAAWIPSPGSRHAAILGNLIIEGDLRGNLIADAHLAALSIELGVAVCSYDTDFARFTQVRWFCPGG
jgi:toxin-antitoxin system PIN domain toxin